MTKFYFLRHGRTVYNKELRIQGARADSPLLDQSVQDARLAGKYLQNIPFEAVYASPLGRTQRTVQLACAAAGITLHPVLVDDWREFDFGKWDGVLEDDVVKRPEFDALINHPSQFDGTALGAESYAHFIQRIKRPLQSVYRQHPSGNVLVVAHAMVISYLLQTIRGLSVDEVRPAGLVANTSISVLETQDGQSYAVPMWNNTEFLK
ncbi:histidine phosphatase family protein [Ligilactobacillus sp. LYQ139]|uniref:histidine phosphatase family protein n=1 Tax=Ligilactobacillus sp. LYQ139 TaxID=3378800 RepID=UPI0038552A03